VFRLLEQMIEIDDPRRGTVRLRPDVALPDEMTLHARSTKTVRMQVPL